MALPPGRLRHRLSRRVRSGLRASPHTGPIGTPGRHRFPRFGVELGATFFDTAETYGQFANGDLVGEAWEPVGPGEDRHEVRAKPGRSTIGCRHRVLGPPALAVGHRCECLWRRGRRRTRSKTLLSSAGAVVSGTPNSGLRNEVSCSIPTNRPLSGRLGEPGTEPRSEGDGAHRNSPPKPIAPKPRPYGYWRIAGAEVPMGMVGATSVSRTLG